MYCSYYNWLGRVLHLMGMKIYKLLHQTGQFERTIRNYWEQGLTSGRLWHICTCPKINKYLRKCLVSPYTVCSSSSWRCAAAICKLLWIKFLVSFLPRLSFHKTTPVQAASKSKDGNFEELLDPRLRGSVSRMVLSEALAVVDRCTGTEPVGRPRIREIIRALRHVVSISQDDTPGASSSAAS